MKILFFGNLTRRLRTPALDDVIGFPVNPLKKFEMNFFWRKIKSEKLKSKLDDFIIGREKEI